jgi:NitT/TauT family transport system permease protein
MTPNNPSTPSPLTRFFGIRVPVGLPARVALGALPILILLIVWASLTAGAPEERVISPLTLPSPLETLGGIRGLWFDAELSRSTLASAWRVVCGFAIALAITLPLGILMGAFSRAKAMFTPLMVFGAYLPIPALVPLTMSLFGTDELQKMAFLAIAFAVYLLPAFVGAIDDVDNVYLQTAWTLGATRLQAIGHVLLGVAGARIFNAMRLGFGVGWSYIILVELVAAERGLGQIINMAQRRGPREYIYLVILVVVIIAYVTDVLWVKLGRTLFPWQERR